MKNFIYNLFLFFDTEMICVSMDNLTKLPVKITPFDNQTNKKILLHEYQYVLYII